MTLNRIGLLLGQSLYSKMNNEAQIYVTDRNSGQELIQANTKIDIDPFNHLFRYRFFIVFNNRQETASAVFIDRHL